MSINYERGNVVRDWRLNQSDLEAQNRMQWDDDYTGAISNYKSNIAYKTSDAGTTPIHSTADSFFYNNNLGKLSGSAAGDYLIAQIGSGNQGNSWITKTYDASQFITNSCQVIIHYTSGTSFTGDAQIAEVNLGSTTWDFETSGDGWVTTTVNSNTLTKDNYTTNGSTATIVNGTIANRWNRDANGTGSSNTGVSTTTGQNGSWYIYAETSSNGYSNKDFICASPTITVDNSTFNIIFGFYGGTIGQTDIYIRVF